MRRVAQYERPCGQQQIDALDPFRAAKARYHARFGCRLGGEEVVIDRVGPIHLVRGGDWTVDPPVLGHVHESVGLADRGRTRGADEGCSHRPADPGVGVPNVRDSVAVGHDNALCQGLLRAQHDLTLITAGMSADEPWARVSTVRLAPSRRSMLMGGARDWDAAVRQVLDELRPEVALAEGLGFAGSAVVKWRGGVRVVVAHGNTVADIRHAYSWVGWAMRAPLVRASCAAAVRKADALVNVTEDWRINCPVAPTHQVDRPNPVDDDFFTSEPAPEPGVVACFGGSKRIKGVDLLLAAWPFVLRDAPHASLELYGYTADGKPALPPNCSTREALDTSSQTAAAMARASAVVVPSRFEVSPLVACL